MPLTKVTTLRDMTRDELALRKRELSDEEFNLRMRRSLKPLDNPLRLRLIRRELARIATLLREDQLGLRGVAQLKTGLLDQKRS